MSRRSLLVVVALPSPDEESVSALDRCSVGQVHRNERLLTLVADDVLDSLGPAEDAVRSDATFRLVDHDDRAVSTRWLEIPHALSFASHGPSSHPKRRAS